ncbi:MAG TPA: phosphate ABC transporter substrate-binding protein PstS [Acidimicrobiales bacterium]
MTDNLIAQPNRRARNRIGRRSAFGVAALAVALTAAACGSSSSTSSNTTTTQGSGTGAKTQCATGTITGAGSTFVNTILTQWIKNYQQACSGSTINYQSVGSGAGVQQFTAGTVGFGASDVPFAASEQSAANAKYPPAALQLPWSAGPISIEYNLSGFNKTLNLSPNTLASIYAGKVKTWNDPMITADNPGASLPSTPIQVVYRSDGSGTTASFTGYMTTVSGTIWTAGASKTVNWPTGQGAKGSDGVTAVVKQTNGAIGYAELSYAKGGQVSTASIKNASGQFVQPSSAGATAALANTTVAPDGTAKINYLATGTTVYPISTLTWVLVPQKPSSNGTLLKDFILYALGPGQQSANQLFYAPLPSSVAQQSQTIANSISG